MRGFISIITVAYICLVSPQFSIAQVAEHSEASIQTQKVVAKLCTLLEENYVFEEKGIVFAKYLKNQLKDGRYDGLQGELLAKALSTDLRSFGDMHMEVLHDPEIAKAIMNPVETKRDEAEYEQWVKRRAERSRRKNYGFHKVENLEGNVGYLDLRSFDSARPALDVTKAAMEFLSNSDALIIDLRKNTGGGTPVFELLISYFFNSEPVNLGGIYFRAEDSLINTFTLEEIEGKRMPDVDLFILTGHDTFSAAEAFAYSLKHLGRAKIIGIKTQGGAHMVDRFAIDEEYWAMISIAAAVNPITGTNWEGVGVIPDISCSADKALKLAHVTALKGLINKEQDLERKSQLIEIVDSLGAKKH